MHRSHSGVNSLTQSVIYLAPSPVTTRMLESCFGEKLLKYLLSMPLGSPNYRICIVVDNDCNVFLPLPVTGLVNTNVYKVVQTFGTLRFDDVQGAVNASADSFPINSHIFRNRATW